MDQTTEAIMVAKKKTLSQVDTRDQLHSEKFPAVCENTSEQLNERSTGPTIEVNTTRFVTFGP